MNYDVSASAFFLSRSLCLNQPMALSSIMRTPTISTVMFLLLCPAISFFPNIATAMIAEEKLALFQSNWWNVHNLSEDPCDWFGIYCNDFGSVISISPYELNSTHQPQLADLNFTAFSNLEDLALRGMGLIGTIPTQIGALQSLNNLDLSYNNLSGTIPAQIGALLNLFDLDLSNNYLNGTIPTQIGALRSLFDLELSNNYLSGTIPAQIGALPNLVDLDLSNNFLSGTIPTQIGALQSLTNLDLSYNNLSGPTPPQIGALQSLNNLDLSYNNLSGVIPTQIGGLHNLTNLDLSYNNLSGSIPRELGRLHHYYINLSYNHLRGYVPSEVYCSSPKFILDGNEELLGLEKVHGSFLKIIIPLTIFPIIIFIVGFILFKSYKNNTKSINETRPKKNGDLFSIWNYDGKIAYEDIIEATEGFDIKYCIGTGAYGSVYRAQLPSGKIVALKKLHRREYGNISFAKNFHNEVQMLSEIRHRSIIKLHGFCLHNECMFLIYECMERGSLFYVLNNDNEAKELDWSMRVNTVKGIANALFYMHHDCAPPIIHRDVTSNNVLLNLKMEAFLSDFGMARILHPDSSNQTLLVGTYGYVAPVLEW